MNRAYAIAVLIIAATTASAAAVFISQRPDAPVMSDEQRETREGFFGSNNDLTPIEKGQEMKPRW